MEYSGEKAYLKTKMVNSVMFVSFQAPEIIVKDLTQWDQSQYELL